MTSQAAPLRRATLSEGAYDAVRALIVDHTIEPLSRLGIDELASSLGVSHTPIREALSRLAAEGLAVYEPLVGYRVSAVLDAKGFDRLMEARFAIEPELAALAAHRSERAGAQRLREDAVMADGEVAGDDYERYRHHTSRDALFHASLATASDNPFLANAMASMRPHLHIYRLHHPRSGFVDTTGEHLAIVEAVAAGDPETAAEAMRKHLDASYHRHSAGLA